MSHGVNSLPSNEHCHDGCLPGAGGEFQRESRQRRVPSLACALKVLEESLPFAHVRRDLGQPDDSLDGFDLAEEWSRSLEIVRTPVLQEPRGLGRDLPSLRIRPRPPFSDLSPQLFNPATELELLLFGRQLVQRQCDLFTALLFRLGNWCEKAHCTTPCQHSLRWQPILLEFPVLPRHGVRRIQDRITEKSLIHSDRLRRDEAANRASLVTIFVKIELL